MAAGRRLNPLWARLRPHDATGSPVFALHFGDHNIDGAGAAAQHLHGDAGDLLHQFFLLFKRAAFEHFEVVSGHGFFGAGVDEDGMPTLPAAQVSKQVHDDQLSDR